MRPVATTRRRGLTLIEAGFGLVVIVVALLIAWPVIRGVGDISKLRRAANQVRDDISSARISSMGTGRMYVLHFETDSNFYQLGPYEAQDPLLEATRSDLEDPTSGLAGGKRWTSTQHNLPEGIRFEFGDFQVPVPEEAEKQLEFPVAPSMVGDGTPVMFYPDGTISDGVLLLRNESDYAIEVKIRGKDGTIFVGEPFEAH